MHEIDRRLHDLIDAAGGATADTPAVIEDGKTLSFGALSQEIRRTARAIAASTGPGARVAVLSWNRLEYLTLLYAIPAAGRIAVLLNARLAPAELAAQIDEAGVELLIAEDELADPLAPLLVATPALRQSVRFGADLDAWVSEQAGAGEGPLPDVAPTDPAWLIFTSGTTSRPKGAVLTHRSILAAVRSAADARPVLTGDVFLYPFPLFHVANHNVVIQHAHGGPVVLVRQFEPAAVLDACVRYGVTTMSLAPTMIAMLLDHPSFDRSALATVRTIGYGASPISEALLRRVLRESDVGLSQGYGMTELSGSVSFLDADGHRLAASEKPHLLRSAGRPVPGVELRLVEDDPAGGLREVTPGAVGEIAVRAPQVMAGYWNQPEVTSAAVVDGWLRTGDLARFDDEGYLYIVDRKKDMIITGGENVASREVEDALAAHPAVRQVCVVGVPDPAWGEAITAIVALRPDVAQASDATRDALVAHCRAHLAGYKKPRRVIFVESVPVNANGKIDKRAMRDFAEQRLRG